MKSDETMIFERYLFLLKEQNLATLMGAQNGGEGGNWGGSLPKLISLLPIGNWQSSSQKRSKKNTKSGYTSDHYDGNMIAYAADFGLNTTFKGDKNAATDFAIKVARNAGKDIASWDPYVGNSFTYNTPDGFRVQIIWQSDVGGNHYDHVHVGVKKGTGGLNNKEAEVQDTDVIATGEKPTGEYADQLLSQLKSSVLGKLTDFSPQTAQKALQGVTGAALAALGPQNLAKLNK